MTKPTDYSVLLEFKESSGVICKNTADVNKNAVIGEQIVVTSTSTDTGDFQGYSTDGTDHYTTGTTALSKWNTGYTTEIAFNSSPFTSLTGSPNHIGGCQYYNSLLYVAVSNFTDCGTNSDHQIAKYNSTTLIYDSHFTVSEVSDSSGVAINADDGYIYVCSFCDGTKIWRYDLSTEAFVNSISLNINVSKANGITYGGGFLYIASVNEPTSTGNDRIYKFTLDGKMVAVYRVPTISEIEDIDVSSGSFRYNSFPEKTIKTATIPTAPSRVAGEFHLDKKYFIDIPFQIPSEFTMIMELTPTSFFNFNSIFDYPAHINQWEMWIGSDSVLKFRISTPNVSFTLPGATTNYKIALTCGINGANRDLKLYVGDVLRSSATSAFIATPDSYFSLGGGNSGNTAGDNVYEYFSLFPRVLTLQEITDFDGVGPLLPSDALIRNPLKSILRDVLKSPI